MTSPLPRERTPSSREAGTSRPGLTTVVLAAVVVGWLATALLLALYPGSVVAPFSHELTQTVLAFLAGLSAFALAGQWKISGSRLVLGVGFAVLLGLALEAIQFYWVDPVRAEGADIAADVLGLGLGAAVYLVLGLALPDSSRTRLLAILLPLVLAGVFLSLTRATGPIGQWWRCSRPGTATTNEAIVISDEVRYNGEGRSTQPAESLVRSISCSGEFTVVATFASADLSQGGPTRIATISSGTDIHQANFHIGIDGSALSVRIRVEPESYRSFVLENVVVDEATHTVAVRFANQKADVFWDGALLERLDLGGYDHLQDWDPDFPLSIGNELSDDRGFSGSIGPVYFVARAMDDFEVSQFSS